jgi:hypothetical protein
MRTVAANVTTAYSASPRTIGARLTLRSKRLVFVERTITDGLGLTDPSLVDTCTYSTGLARVVNLSGALYTELVPDVHVTGSWPSWVNRSIPLKVGSRPGCEGVYVWYQKSNGDICYRSLASWSTEVVVTSAYAAYTVAIAPLGTTAYIQYLDGLWLAVAYVAVAGCVTWEGRVYGDVTSASYIDAVTLSGKDYIYVMDRNAGRVLEIVKVGTMWGGWTYVLPVDDIDNVSGFTLGAASIINSQIFLSGRLVRTSDDEPVSFDMFSIGPRHFSLGREAFLTSKSLGGKMFLLTSEVIYAGVTTVCTAPATMLVGYDNAALKTVTSAISTMLYSEAENEGCGLNASVARDQTGIARGNDVDFEISYGGLYTKISTLNIDTITTADDETGKSLEFYAIGSGIKSVAEWIPDTSLWLPSQAKMSCAPSDMEQVVISSGELCEVNGYLVPTEMNTDGVAYSVARAARGSLMRGKFCIPTEATSRHGVIANFYRESQYEASVRLGIDQDSVTEDQFGNNGIVAVYGLTEYSGAPGVGLYLWSNNVFTLLTSASLTIAAETLHWLEIYFHDGLIRVNYRLDSSTAWTNLISTLYVNQSRLPWMRETFGRGAIYLQNATAHSTGYGFYADDLFIPVADNSTFPTSGTVIVDDEQISYTSKSNNYTPVTNLCVLSGVFERGSVGGVVNEGFVIFADTGDAVNPDDYYKGMVVTVQDGNGKGKAFKIIGYDAQANWGGVSNSARRIIVDKDPTGFIKINTLISIVPCLNVPSTGRAQNSTEASAHDDTALVSIYNPIFIQCAWADYYSCDRDNSVEDGISEVCFRAGTYGVFNDLITNPVLTPAWDSEMVGDAYNPIFDFTVPALTTGQQVGVVFCSLAAATGTRSDGPAIVSGYMITVHNISGVYYLELWKSAASSWSLVEQVPLWFTPQGTMRISIQDSAFSVWSENLFLHTFYNTTYVDLGPSLRYEYAGFTASFATTITGSLAEMHDFVEDIIIDNKTKGINTIERINNGRLVFYCSEVNGGIRFFRVRYDTGAASSFGWSHTVETSSQLFTRIRSEGLKTVETADFDLMSVYGNLFNLISTPYASRVIDFRRAAERVVAEQEARSTLHTFMIIPHPALEVGDTFRITPVSTELVIDITALQIKMDVAGNPMAFEEMVQGNEHL